MTHSSNDSSEPQTATTMTHSSNDSSERRTESIPETDAGIISRTDSLLHSYALEGGRPHSNNRVISSPDSSHGITPRTDNSSNDSSALRTGNTPRTDSSTDSSVPRTRLGDMGIRKEISTTESPLENTPSAGEVSSYSSDRYGVAIQISKTESTQAGSPGEVEYQGMIPEKSNSGDDKFVVENIDRILDEFEIYDPEERAEIQKNLSVQGEGEALEAVEKVSHVAQSSLRRLQKVVKEKDELIVALQEAVGSAYKTALVQHERDQKDLEQLHQMLLAQDDRRVEAVKNSLQEVIRLQPESGNGLAGQVAKLFDQYLHEISSQHEEETETLQKNLTMWRSRCGELEGILEREKQHWNSHLGARLADSVLDWERGKQQLETSEAMVVILKEQLNEKDEQLRVYRESLETLEKWLDEEKERQAELADDYNQITTDTRQTLNKVSVVNRQIRQLKQETSTHQLQGHANDVEVKRLQEKLDNQNATIHKLAVQLASCRRNSSRRSRGTECKECDRLVETEKQLQLLRDCIPALVAQVLEMKRRIEKLAKDSDNPELRCLHDFVQLTTDDGAHSEDLSGKDSPGSLVKDSLRLVTRETIKKLEGHEKITRKAELLQKRLEACKQAMENTDIELSRSGAQVEHLKYELRKAREIIRDLEKKLQKREENKKSKPTDCVRIKGLLENIEMLEMESTLLKQEVMVQKNRQIARLERELKKARGFDSLGEGRKRTESSLKYDPEKLEASTWDKVKMDLEDTIFSKDSLILELRFEVDQAAWKLTQVEKRFDILFGALDCKKIEFDEPVADSVLENIFSSEKLVPPVLNLLREKVLIRRGYSRVGNREKELESLVEALMKVVEKVSNENEKLKITCDDTVKQMEKNKELRKVVQNLQDQIAKNGQSPARERPNSGQAIVITVLKRQLSDLAEANVGLVRALRETEDQYSGLKQMVHKQFNEEQNPIYHYRKKSRKGMKIFFSEDEHTEQLKSSKLQAATISQLEQEVALKGQEIRNLNHQLSMKEEELDLIHGKLSIKMSHEECENIQPSTTDIWGFSKAESKYQNANQKPGDIVDNQYLVEHDYELMEEENQRLRTYVRELKNPDLLQEIRDMKSQNQRMSKVCDRYEELLRIYSRQIGVPFSPLRE